MSLLRVDRLTVRYAANDAAALDNVSFELRKGECLAVIGESGSGKSTLASALAGILPNTASVSGSIAWTAKTQPPRPGRDIGLVFQDPAASLDPVMKVGVQIAEVAHTHLGISWTQARANAVDLIARVRLPDPERLAHAYPHQLSGGQKQRIAIAAALAGNPELLIADEATSALDTIVQAEIVALLEDLTRANGTTLLFISHDIALASQLADRIAVFRHAKLLEIGDTRRVLTEPANAYTASLVETHLGVAT